MTRILVYAPLEDETHISLEEAARLARASGGSLHVLRVLDAQRWLGSAQPDSARGKRLCAFLEESQRETLESLVAPLRASGLEVHTQLSWGTPWLELVRTVLRESCDLVVKTAEGVARGTGLFFGSTALHLVRKCPCAVWIVSAPSQGRTPRVLAAIDPQVDDPVRCGLARRILNAASSLSEFLGGELHAAAVWPPAAVRPLEGRLDRGESDAWLHTLESEARLGLDKITSEADPALPGERMHLLEGDVRRVLPELIAREGFDVLAMGSLGRVGISGLLIGDTAETLIRSVRCSVLVLKPPGFVCPVRLEDA